MIVFIDQFNFCCSRWSVLVFVVYFFVSEFSHIAVMVSETSVSWPSAPFFHNVVSQSVPVTFLCVRFSDSLAYHSSLYLFYQQRISHSFIHLLIDSFIHSFINRTIQFFFLLRYLSLCPMILQLIFFCPTILSGAQPRNLKVLIFTIRFRLTLSDIFNFTLLLWWRNIS